MSGQLLYLDRLDVAHDQEASFNRLYQREVLPQLRKVPGVLHVAHYQTESRRDPRHTTIYEIANSDIVGNRDWTEAVEKTPWRQRLLPFVMNRRRGVYARIGGRVGLGYATKHILFVSLDIEAQKEALLNELYDTEHIPLLLPLPGVANVVRYKAADGHPRYLALYEIDDPDIPTRKDWIVASDTGRWKLEVKPYTYNRSFVVYENIAGAKGTAERG